MKRGRRLLVVLVCLVIVAGAAIAAAVYRSHHVIGHGTAPPTAVWIPTETDFGFVEVGSTAERTLRLKNVGRAGLSGWVRMDEGCSSNFEIVSGGGTYTLGPGQSRTVIIRFSPSDTLTVYECDLRSGP